MRVTWADKPDAIVIGAGIVGVSTALHLQMRGKKVVLIDRRPVGRETSYGNAGIIGNTYVLPFGFPSWRQVLPILLDRDISARVRYASLPRALPWLIDFYLKSRMKVRKRNAQLILPLQLHSLEEHQKLVLDTEAGHLIAAKGRALLYRSKASFLADEELRRAARELGMPFEIMTPKAFRTLEPHLNPVFNKAMVMSASHRITDPGALVVAYAKKFVRDGGIFIRDEVKGFEQLNGVWSVETTKDAVMSGQVVICAGPWSAEMLKLLGYRFPLAFKRGYHRHFKPKDGATLDHALVDVDNGYVLSSMEQGIRLTTGVEIAGLHAPPDPVQIRRAVPKARELFPLGAPVEKKSWCGSRPCFADSLPVIGPASRHNGLWLNFGHGHWGMTIGPSSGRLLVEMMTGSKTFCDPAPYSAARFNC